MLFAAALLATLVNAPGVSSEIVSAPIAQPQLADTPGPPFTVAKTNDGFVVAWSGVEAGSRSRIFVARLDETAHAVGSARALGDKPAYNPALAVDGDRIVLGWLERGIDGKYREVVTALDRLAGGTPVVSGLVTTTLIVGARDGHTFVVTDDSSYDYAGGKLVSATRIAQQPDSAVFIPGSMLYSAHDMILQTTICGFGDCQSSGPSHYVLYLGHDSNSPTTQAFNQDTSAHRTAIAFGSNHTGLLAWYIGSFNSGGSVVAVRLAPPQVTIDDAARPLVLGTFGPSSRAAQPSIAWDGERYLVVWQAQDPFNINIHAATVDLNGIVTPLAFPPAALSETNPVAVAVAPGRFLVAYQIEGADTRIGGRFIEFHRKPHAGGR